MAFAPKFFAYVLGLGLAACTQQASQQAPIEHLPNPETGKEKPQLYFIFEKSETFWNLPIAEEIDLKLRTHTHLFVSDDEQELQNKLREFNARSHSFLLLSSNKLQALAETLSVYKHPSRAFSLGVNPSSSRSFAWALDSTKSLISNFCTQNVKIIFCELDSKLPSNFTKGFKLPPKSEQAQPLLISFDRSASGDKLILSWDWIVWLEQVFRNFNNPSQAHDNSPWKTLSLENGNFRLDLQIQPSSKIFDNNKELHDTLIDLRMKVLQGN